MVDQNPMKYVRRFDEIFIADIPHVSGKNASLDIDRLAEGVGTIAAAFHTKPIIVRMSDFKSKSNDSF